MHPYIRAINTAICTGSAYRPLNTMAFLKYTSQTCAGDYCWCFWKNIIITVRYSQRSTFTWSFGIGMWLRFWPWRMRPWRSLVLALICMVDLDTVSLVNIIDVYGLLPLQCIQVCLHFNLNTKPLSLTLYVHTVSFPYPLSEGIKTAYTYPEQLPICTIFWAQASEIHDWPLAAKIMVSVTDNLDSTSKTEGNHLSTLLTNVMMNTNELPWMSNVQFSFSARKELKLKKNNKMIKNQLITCIEKIKWSTNNRKISHVLQKDKCFKAKSTGTCIL